jgi:hypothetical protein
MEDLTEEEIQAADLVLTKLRLNDPLDWKGDFIYWLREERDKHNDNRFTSLISDTTDATYNRVHGFLLELGYIGRWRPGKEEKFLTEKGVLVREKGGHKKYIIWIKRKKIFNNIKEIAFWITFTAAIISAIYVVLTYYGNGDTKNQQLLKSKSKKEQTISSPSKSLRNDTIKGNQAYLDSLKRIKTFSKHSKVDTTK